MPTRWSLSLRGSLSGHNLLAGDCQLLYERHGTYKEVARRTKLDRRTVKAYLEKVSGAEH